MNARPGLDKTPIPKVSFVTRAGDNLGCAVGYYKGAPPFVERTQASSLADFYYLGPVFS
jgi:hypothetical protein